MPQDAKHLSAIRSQRLDWNLLINSQMCHKSSRAKINLYQRAVFKEEMDLLVIQYVPAH